MASSDSNDNPPSYSVETTVLFRDDLTGEADWCNKLLGPESSEVAH